MVLRRFFATVALLATVTMAGCGNDPAADTGDVDNDPGSTSTPATAPSEDDGGYDY